MRKFFWVLVLFCTATKWMISQTDADYDIAVHVSSARYDGIPVSQILNVVIGGKHFEMRGPTLSPKNKTSNDGHGLLNPGDYKAKLTLDTHKTPFESIQEYEFLLPDGTKRKFAVILQSE